MDPNTFADTLFKSELKASHQIQIQLEDMDMGDLFEFLLIVFTNGLKILYGNNNNKVDLSKLSTQQFKKLNDYFHSFGFDAVYVVYPMEAENVYDFNSMNYQNINITSETKLEDLCFPMKTQEIIYVIGFRFQPIP